MRLSSEVPPRHLRRRDQNHCVGRDEEDRNQLDDGGSQLAVTTLEGSFFDTNQADPIRGIFYKSLNFIL